jgi:hypothetical protein
MGQSLDQILEKAVEGSIVSVALVSNQNDGVATYAVGDLVFHPATAGASGPTFRPARLQSEQPFTMLFSDRRLDIDPPPEPGTFGHDPRQLFSANAAERLGLSITLQLGTSVMQLAVFGSKASVSLKPVGDLLVGLGPSLSPSGAAGVFVVAFLSVRNPF